MALTDVTTTWCVTAVYNRPASFLVELTDVEWLSSCAGTTTCLTSLTSWCWGSTLTSPAAATGNRVSPEWGTRQLMFNWLNVLCFMRVILQLNSQPQISSGNYSQLQSCQLAAIRDFVVWVLGQTCPCCTYPGAAQLFGNALLHNSGLCSTALWQCFIAS